jgi:hypothetical protein
MKQELADEAVVAVKPAADEDMATYLRVKLLDSDKKLKAKGGMCESGDGPQTVTLLRDQNKSFNERMATYEPFSIERVDEGVEQKK